MAKATSAAQEELADPEWAGAEEDKLGPSEHEASSLTPAGTAVRASCAGIPAREPEAGARTGAPERSPTPAGTAVRASCAGIPAREPEAGAREPEAGARAGTPEPRDLPPVPEASVAPPFSPEPASVTEGCTGQRSIIRLNDLLSDKPTPSPEDLEALVCDVYIGLPVVIWSNTFQRWFHDGIIDAVDENGLNVEYNGGWRKVVGFDDLRTTWIPGLDERWHKASRSICHAIGDQPLPALMSIFQTTAADLHHNVKLLCVPVGRRAPGGQCRKTLGLKALRFAILACLPINATMARIAESFPNNSRTAVHRAIHWLHSNGYLVETSDNHEFTIRHPEHASQARAALCDWLPQ